MAGPTTDIEIMSNAATLLGKRSFATIDDADEFAVSLQKFYDLLVDSELAKNAWKFAKKQISLSLVAGFNPDFAEYSAAYDLPADFLSLVRLFPHVPFQIFGPRIYTGSSGTLKIEYNYRAPVTHWSAPFKEYMVYSLATIVAASVTEDPSLMQMIAQERRSARASAMFVDAQNSPNRAIQSNPWLEVRGRGNTRSGWGQ